MDQQSWRRFFQSIENHFNHQYIFDVFEKINYHNYLAKKETLDKSIFFNPIQKIAGFIFPSIEKWYDKARK